MDEQSEASTYDALDRVIAIADSGNTWNGTAYAATNLGNFTLAYNGSTVTGNSTQLTGVAYPNGLNTTLGYFNATQGAWLANITNNYTSGNTTLLSEFDYTHRGDGSIASWQQQFGGKKGSGFTFIPELGEAVGATVDAAGRAGLRLRGGLAGHAGANCI